tara:strand:- start:363 stop:1304 length:942 start_codon:yes stop_codon:yes gene_type:complete
MKQGWHIGVVIPARNEENHIVEVLEGLPEIVDVAVVVNDGSTDGTADKVTDATASCEVILLHGHGDGVGASIDRGHKHLLGLFTAPFISVVMAGDGQMNPNDMEALIQPLLDGNADHVKGNRELHADGFNEMPQHRQRASRILTWFTTLAAGQPISDPQCGFTATTSDVLETWDWNRSWAGYGYPNFWLINLSKQGYRIREVPVESIYRTEESGIKPSRFFLSVGWMMAVEHHRRNLAWLRPKNLTPHTLFALMSYVLGWSAILPFLSNDLEVELISRGFPQVVLCLSFWAIAHLFDRAATRVHRELRLNATT